MSDACANPDAPRPCPCAVCEKGRDKFRSRTAPPWVPPPPPAVVFYIRSREYRPTWDCGPWVWVTHCEPYEHDQLNRAIGKALDLHAETGVAVTVVECQSGSAFAIAPITRWFKAARPEAAPPVMAAAPKWVDLSVSLLPCDRNALHWAANKHGRSAEKHARLLLIEALARERRERASQDPQEGR